MSGERKITRVTKLTERDQDKQLASATPAERLAMMWQLTLDAWPSKESRLLNSDFRDILSAFSDLTHLIQNRKAGGRPQDEADVARLEALRS